MWVDADGSILAGLPEAGCGKQIVGAGPLVRTAGCVAKPAWNAYVCTLSQPFLYILFPSFLLFFGFFDLSNLFTFI